MGDLISRSVLIEKLNTEKVNGADCLDIDELIRYLIEDCPTAFDKDKVIEQLERKSGGYYSRISGVLVTSINIALAIAIVKGGGISE